MGRDMGVHGQEQEVRPGLDRRRRNISTTESLFERARATLTPLSFSRHRRDGQGLSTKAPVHVPGAPERGKPYWTLMDPKEAGRLWRKQYGDKVPAPAEESKPSGT